jgi:HD-like signal output (HDOD) protein/DNA-binding CsgD family transcriptional regulator
MLAFDALERFPAIAQSRDRVLSSDRHATADVVSAIESDVALTAAVLRLANTEQAVRGRVDTVAGAVGLLRPQAIQALANRVRTFDFFARARMWDRTAERFRLHALATQRAADRIASNAGYANRDRLAVASLLHDVGKLVLIHAHPGYETKLGAGSGTPEERIGRERSELGVDHALVGGVLIRHWRLPSWLATTIERHHDPYADGEAAIIRLADMLAIYERGGCVSPSAMLQSARAVGLDADKLRQLLHEPLGPNPRKRPIDPSPLTRRELTVLRQLARGSVYNQIAHDLTLSVSTIRSHLSNIYGKLGVVDRAQAVLLASERGWLSSRDWAPQPAATPSK